MKTGQKSVLIISAPSGAGKSTIVEYLISRYDFFGFSVSATSREPRGNERDGIEYFFMSEAQFKEKISLGQFVEYEEVYPGQYYGTLKSEVERIWSEDRVILFDIDVIGGLNLKKLYGEKALSVFIAPPSIEILRERITKRGTDSLQSIEKRVAKAGKELERAAEFDVIIVNDKLEKTFTEVEQIIKENFPDK